MNARRTTHLRVDHSQLATIRLRLTEAILRKEGDTTTVRDAVDRAKDMADRLLAPREPR